MSDVHYSVEKLPLPLHKRIRLLPLEKLPSLVHILVLFQGATTEAITGVTTVAALTHSLLLPLVVVVVVGAVVFLDFFVVMTVVLAMVVGHLVV